jgi:hypothetical protein
MSKFLYLLKEHPGFGFLSTVVASLQAFMNTSSPVLQYIGLVIGVAIGAVTLALKIR